LQKITERLMDGRKINGRLTWIRAIGNTRMHRLPRLGRLIKRILAIALVSTCLLLTISGPFETKGAELVTNNMPRDLNTPREFPSISSLPAWQVRAKEIREQVLVSCGLWPMPERTPLNPNIFGRIERDGYSVEKVYIQTAPGFYLAGNLYRPLGRGKGLFPGILNPHGHWKEGRFADNKDGSIAGRCISFARRGMVAFTYDMVGFNDTHFAAVPSDKPFYDVHRQFGTERADQLWSISLLGLQTWNSIRALDFLASLPDVDHSRLACTGESGGGTQTFMLGAIDDRLAVQAPIVMVSHTMQGGCSCENSPGLRVEYSNMEIAATPAPRPQLLVAAAGDWTKDTLTVEGPSIQRIYELFGAPNKFRYTRFDFGHNYNQTSREAVYAWFGKWLLSAADDSDSKEAPFRKEPDADLLVFPDGKLPKDAKTREEFVDWLKRDHEARWQSLVPGSKAAFQRFQDVILPAWRHTLQLSSQVTPESRKEAPEISDGCATAKWKINVEKDSAPVLATYRAPEKLHGKAPSTIVVIVNPGESDGGGKPTGLASKLLESGVPSIEIQRFTSDGGAEQFTNFFTTYNRTRVQKRVRDLLAVCSAARSNEAAIGKTPHVILLGRGRAGVWVMLAARGADAVIADGDNLDSHDDQSLLEPDLFCPGIRSIGTFEGGAMLAAPHPLALHNTGERFSVTGLQAAYKAAGAKSALRLEPRLLGEDALVKWIKDTKL
jgi:dienelactone hydrolase